MQLSCRSFAPRSKFNTNSAQFCDRDVDRAISRAFELQGTDPRAAAELWTRVDRMIVDRALWVFTVNPKKVQLVSERVGNYQAHVQWGVLLDQLWVR